jgi:hypothetical protein
MTIRSDLTGFAALLGESFASRIDLLGQLIQTAHYPSLGTYKERLLARTIRDYVPKSLGVGTGFVLFPHEDANPSSGQNHDPLNKSAFTLSRQCDILVYDANSYPPVFRDEDFVVLRPEAVRAVIEVKGTLNRPETNSIIESFIDFGQKWRTTQHFYRSHHQGLTEFPVLCAIAWKIGSRKNGSPLTDATKIREQISSAYAQKVPVSDLDGFPILRHLYVYGEAEISYIYGFDQSVMNAGWASQDGRFKRFDNDGQVYRDKDRTIASLLANLHYASERENFNRFFSYMDETNNNALLPFPHSGCTWAWKGIKSSREKPFNSAFVYQA